MEKCAELNCKNCDGEKCGANLINPNYVSVLRVNAEPMTLKKFNESKGIEDNNSQMDGYLVCVHGEPEKWIPKHEFESKFKRITWHADEVTIMKKMNASNDGGWNIISEKDSSGRAL